MYTPNHRCQQITYLFLIFISICILIIPQGCSLLSKNNSTESFSRILLFERLHKKIRNRMTYEEVKSILGTGDIDKENECLQSHLSFREFSAFFSNFHPEGVKESDAFIKYFSDNKDTTIVLQFRNNHLINHQPLNYSNPSLMHNAWISDSMPPMSTAELIKHRSRHPVGNPKKDSDLPNPSDTKDTSDLSEYSKWEH